VGWRGRGPAVCARVQRRSWRCAPPAPSEACGAAHPAQAGSARLQAWRGRAVPVREWRRRRRPRLGGALRRSDAVVRGHGGGRGQTARGQGRVALGGLCARVAACGAAAHVWRRALLGAAAVCRQAQHRQVGHLVVRVARRLGPRAVQGSEAFAHPRREGRADEGVDPRVASGGGAAGGGGVRGRRRRIEHRMQVGRRPLQHAWKVHRRRPPQRGPEARHVQDEFRLQRLQRREPAAREQVLLRARCSDAARARSQVGVEVEVRLCWGGAAWGWAELWYGGWDCGTPGARPSR